MTPKIKLAFLSGTEDLNRRLIEHMRALYPEFPLWVVADFPPEDPALKWIRYRVNRPFADNLRTCREALRGHTIRLAAFQAADADPRMNGGYWFGRKRAEPLPFINPVSAAFATQALELWETSRAGGAQAHRHLLI